MHTIINNGMWVDNNLFPITWIHASRTEWKKAHFISFKEEGLCHFLSWISFLCFLPTWLFYLTANNCNTPVSLLLCPKILFNSNEYRILVNNRQTVKPTKMTIDMIQSLIKEINNGIFLDICNPTRILGGID